MSTLPIALVRSVVLAPMAAFLERERLPYEGLFETVRLSPRLLKRPDELILLGQACTLLEKISRSTGIENIGLLAANTIKLNSFVRLRDMASEGETLFEALHQFAWRIAAFNTAERLSLQWQGERLFFLAGMRCRLPL